MRVVLDTNVLVDALADDLSPQARLLQAVQQGDLTAVVTLAVKREYVNILRRLTTPEEQTKLGAFLNKTALRQPARVPDLVIDDPDDKKFVEAAVGGEADLLVTNDRHLLDIGAFRSLAILTPAEAWRRWQAEHVGDEEWQTWARGLGLIVCLAFAIAPAYGMSVEAASQSDLRESEQAIEALTEQITQLRNKKDDAEHQADIIQRQMAALTQRLAKAKLEMQQTQQLVQSVQDKKKQTEDSIAAAEVSINAKKSQLRRLIRLLYSKEQSSLIDVLLSAHNLSAFLAEQAAISSLQDHSLLLMQDVQEEAETLRAHEADLAEQQEELESSSRILRAQQDTLDAQKKEQTKFLTATREEQARFEQKIIEAKAARAEIEAGLFALKSSGVRLSFSSAQDMAQHASNLTGVRPSLLLAVLKIESGLGANIGSGTFPDDMQPASRPAFLRLAQGLGREPSAMPISRAVSYGWGGAMGPAQIMPATWEGISPQLSALLKKTVPDPYDLSDAFIATALILSNKGAATPASEREAVGRYLAGPNWQNFPWYIDRVFAVAEEYAKEGMS